VARRWWRTPRRTTVVGFEAALALIAVGVAAQSIAGYVVGGIALVVGVALLVRRRGRGLLDIARDHLRDPLPEPAPEPEADPGDPADPADPGLVPGDDQETDLPTEPVAPDLGVARRLLPGLHVAEVTTRDGGPLGVVGDGQGFAVVLNATVAAPGTWSLADAVTLLAEDPARPAAVQLLVEQRRGSAAVADPGFGPSRTYRDLPVGGIPLWNRVLLVIRHEPAWAPETVAARGGGAIGARNALAAVAGRTVAAAARAGVLLRPAGPAEVCALLRDMGDPGPGFTSYEEAWTTPTACHGVVSVAVEDAQAIDRLLHYAAWLDVDRSVLSVTANAIDHSLSAALRVVAPDVDRVVAATESLARDGHATRLPNLQDVGVVATLPLGGGARSLADLVNQVRT
jgi:hypothetical protein